jgi:hypothetical protein
MIATALVHAWVHPRVGQRTRRRRPAPNEHASSPYDSHALVAIPASKRSYCLIERLTLNEDLENERSSVMKRTQNVPIARRTVGPVEGTALGPVNVHPVMEGRIPNLSLGFHWLSFELAFGHEERNSISSR